MLSLFILTVALIAVTRWLYHLPVTARRRRYRPNTRKETKS